MNQQNESDKSRVMANAIRALSMDAVQKANSGHPGLPMGAADLATALFTQVLKFDAADPHWPDRDRFVLSAGHGSMLLYSLLYLLGYEDMTLDQIKNFRQLGSKTAGHPEYGHASGIETTTGPLGQGLANAVGMAIAERHLNARFGDDLVNHRTYVLAGDGCLMEGISQEAIAFAGHLKLNRLIVLFDDNGISIDGKVSLADSTDQLARFAASGWAVTRVRRLVAIGSRRGIVSRACFRPTLAHRLQDDHRLRRADQAGHRRHAWLAARARMKLPARARRSTGRMRPSRFRPIRSKPGAQRVVAARATAPPGSRASRRVQTKLNSSAPWRAACPTDTPSAMIAYKQELAANPPWIATRNASQNALDVINAALPDTLGGSADLTGSNNTKSKDMKPLTAADYGGRYIHYGIREHGMAAAMNGMALHGGVIPYGGTFLCFTDYCRPSIRLAALMGIRVIFVMTHDSIGLGEDGPTHQPVEHMAALRVIPNLHVMRPCDAVETAECWEIALAAEKTPSRTGSHAPEIEAGAPHLFGKESLARSAPMRSRPRPRKPRS